VVVLGLLVACGDDAPAPDASVGCTRDDQCSDGVFCNGDEVCAPDVAGANAFGCAGSPPSCLVGQSCDEEMDRCATLCEVTEDADGDGVAATECGGDDCDDSDPARFPGATEVCDAEGIDEDCDPTTLGGRDLDGDGFEDAACCNGDTCGGDCADRLATVNPGAAEVCDLIDQDCDGNVDEGVQSSGFEDRDGDRHGDPERPRMACAFDGDVTPSMVDCADGDGRRHGQMLEICDGQDNDCDDAIDEERFSVSWYADADGDGFGDPGGEVRASCEPIEGFSTLPFDCDDADASRSPITPEACNALDDDCDGRADFQLAVGDTEDDDGDGFADMRCPGGGPDCDDRDPFANPDTPELCDGVDNDCDGAVDEGATEQLWYVDEDGDGYGDESAERRASCERLNGLVLRGGDCDDGDDGVRPGGAERCNGVDDDCDGTVDEDAGFVATYADDDGDGFGTGMPLAQCAVPSFRALTPGDCDDRNAATSPGAPELCDQLDNDCDGAVDEGIGTVPITTFADADGDGFGDPATELTETPTVADCSYDPTRTTRGGDCDDADPALFPGAPELCDTVDQDCDGAVDEDAMGVDQYVDADGDGYGAGTPTNRCEPIAGSTLRGTDCDDGEGSVRPGAPERCNGVDDDCDGLSDEAPAGTLDCPLDATNATPVCTAGVCGYGACLPGFGDCDGTTANGCESTLATDPRHCGGCGMSCGLGDSCTASACDELPVDAIATSATAGCALRAGQVYCWGDDRNSAGIVGDGSDFRELVLAPMRPVLGLTDAVDIVAGAFHFCALRATGDAVCWGRGNSGQLGHGLLENAEGPALVTGGHTWAQLGAGDLQTCGRRTDGAVFCWGDRTATPETAVPVEVTRTDGSSMNATELGVGSDHVCVIDAVDDRVRCAGRNSSEQLGSDAPNESPTFDLPVAGLTIATQLGIGGATSCARLMDGTVECWGDGRQGQLGDGTLTTSRRDPLPVLGLADAVSVSIGTLTVCAVRATGNVVCWGDNRRLQMGDPAFTDDEAPAPRVVPGLTGASAVDAHDQTGTGAFGPVCAAADSRVFCWGPGSQGRAGDGVLSTDNRAPPVAVVGFP
jgi:hypothetical protein